MDWIPVTDSLPPIGKRVLACSWMSVSYFVAYVSPLGGWCLAFGDSPILNITHWMPLPELPKGAWWSDPRPTADNLYPIPSLTYRIYNREEEGAVSNQGHKTRNL